MTPQVVPVLVPAEHNQPLSREFCRESPDVAQHLVVPPDPVGSRRVPKCFAASQTRCQTHDLWNSLVHQPLPVVARGVGLKRVDRQGIRLPNGVAPGIRRIERVDDLLRFSTQSLGVDPGVQFLIALPLALEVMRALVEDVATIDSNPGVIMSAGYSKRITSGLTL